MSALAPIVLFAYSRPEHTRRTVEALLGNELAEESVLYVYSDAAKESGDQGQVDETRSYIRSITGFRNISIIEREENYGLARNISEGVTAICNKHGRAIVIEDDVVTSPLFLRYMNHALDRYADQKSVWHVSGWNYPIESDGLGDAFLWRVMNCWGWGTWADRWAHFSKNPERLVNSWDDQMIKRFNLDGAHDFWSQVTANLRG
ncbi:MAG: sugar transferase, partial [Gammaproteobacteria bacterium]